MTILVLWSLPLARGAQSIPPDGATAHDLVEQIVDGIENRYSGTGFVARFVQQSTLKAMEITDTASGRVYAKDPGMMRWEYATPDPQVIVTDGSKLWIYRPDDHQVMMGRAPTFFGAGKGAGFLADIKTLRKSFDIRIEAVDDPQSYSLKLVPVEKMTDLSAVHLTVIRETFDVVEVTTLNTYEDETRIRLVDVRFIPDMDNALFDFKLPEGVDVVQLDQ